MRSQNVRLLILACLILCGCGKSGDKPLAAEALEASSAPAADVIASRLPVGTIAYVRLEGANNLEERLTAVLPSYLNDAAPVRAKLDAWYADAIRAAGRNNPLGLKEPTVKRLAAGTRSVHVGVLPPPADTKLKPEPLPVVFLRLDSANTLKAVLEDMKATRKPKDVKGAHGYALDGMGPLEAAIPVDDTTLALGPDALLAQVLAGPGAESLAGSKPFQKAYSELASRGDLFAFLSVTAIKEEVLRDIDRGQMPAEVKEKRRKDIANLPFREVGTVAAAVAVDGVLSVVVYTNAGQEFPEFLVRTPTVKKLPGRIPADAVFTHICGYDGGKKTRKGFVDWLKDETQRGGLDALGIERSVAGALTQSLERLESDVVIKVRGIAEDLWLAAIPVRSEAAMAAAPDARGRWGFLMAFDIEDRTQAEKLANEIFVAGKGADLPWKKTEHAGLTIQYLDLEEILKDKAGAKIPQEVLDSVQMQIGYAMSDELFLAGSVELIKFAHRPTGRTLANTISTKGVDEKNVLLYNFQPGPLLHTLAKIEPLSATVQPLTKRLPREANYTITLTVEKDRAALRSNIPLSVLAAWGVAEWMGAGAPTSD